MSKHFKRKSFSDEDSSHGETDVVGLIKKLQQQVTYLERKIDILINQSGERAFPPKHFSASSRPFRPGPRHESGEREHGPRERNFSHGRPFEQRHGEERQGFPRRKKQFFDRFKKNG